MLGLKFLLHHGHGHWTILRFHEDVVQLLQRLATSFRVTDCAKFISLNPKGEVSVRDFLQVRLTVDHPEPSKVEHSEDDEELVANTLDAGLCHLNNSVVPDPA